MEGVICIFWKSNLKCLVLDNRTQYITMQIDINSGLEIVLTLVSATCDGNIRRSLWTALISSNYSFPSMVMGDFNVEACLEDKFRGKAINLNDVTVFNSLISNRGLEDGGFS